MKFCENTNYFARYMRKKQHEYKSTIANSHTKTQSTNKTKQNFKRQTTDNISPIPFPLYNQSKKKQTHKKVISTPIELIIPGKIEHHYKPSFEELHNESDNINFPLKDFKIEEEDMTVKQINFLENKIMSIINIIDAFEKENNLNQDQDHYKNSLIFQEEELKTERIRNKFSMIEYISPLNSSRIHRTNRNPSISAQESTNYYTKKNYNCMNNNNNSKRRVISNSLPVNYNYNASHAKTHYKSFSMKKMTQASSRFIDLKQATFRPQIRDYSNNKSIKLNHNQNQNTSKQIKIYPNQLKPKKQLKKQSQTSKGSMIKNNKNFFLGNYIKDNTITPIDKNDFIDDDLSINLIIEDNKTNRSNLQIPGSHGIKKKSLVAIPIKNFLKIKEQRKASLLSQTKCESERIKRTIKQI